MAKRTILVDSARRELEKHGTETFPMTVNHDDLWSFEGKNVPIHWHNDLEINLIREGEAVFQVYQKSYRVRTGEGFLLNRNVPHSCSSPGNEHVRYSTILVRPDFLYGDFGSDVERKCFQPFLQNSAIPCIYLTGFDENGKEILQKLNQVEEAFDRKRFCYELKIKGLLCEAFAMILYGHRQELTKEKMSKTLKAGAIYTRVNDQNTPRELTANMEHTEYLWRKRFGIDMTPSEKLMKLLEDVGDWSETRWDIDRHSYNIHNPEYQINVLDSQDTYETLSYFYDDERMLYAPLKLNYLTTTLYETELWYMDMGRCLIPKPEHKYDIEHGVYYYYIEKDSLNGKLLPLFAYGKSQCCDRSGREVPVLIFENKKMRTKFENWLEDNLFLKEKYIADLENSAIFQHIKRKEAKNGKSTCGVLEVAVAFRFYKKWIKQREEI